MNIIFDGDDTIWANNLYFQKAIDDLILLLSRDWSEDKIVLFTKNLNNIEYTNSRAAPYGITDFQNSLLMAIKVTDNTYINNYVEEHIAHINKYFLLPPQLIDNSNLILKKLKIKNKLYLYTKGHINEQLAKIKSLNIETFFEDIAIVDSKNILNLEQTINRWSLNKLDTYYIGDSYENDIIIANKAGLKTIYFNNGHSWAKENIQHENDLFLYNFKISNLNQIFEVVKKD